MMADSQLYTEREAVVAWLREDAAEQRNDLRGLHARKMLTRSQTLEWETQITTKMGIADAIERGDHLKTAERGEEK